VELEQNKDEYRKLGLGVAAISYDTPAILHHFAERRGIHFPLLSDADSKVIRALGILNETVAATEPFFGIPHPGSFLLDAKGVIVAKYFEEDYRQRYTSADILLNRFGVLPSSGQQEVAGRQLSLKATASNSIVGAGHRVALTLDIELRPHMHVYAPDVEGYIPIAWTMKESPAAEIHEVTYPASEKLHLVAIDETVPVFHGHFRLTRDITIGPNATLHTLVDSSGKFTVEGTLRYQACDDQVCYIPQELPVKWTLQYEEFDRQRVPEALQRK
jgi:hypothetical protein